MPTLLLRRFLKRFLRDGGSDDTGTDGDNNRFVPSPLDISVHEAHGGSRAADREIANIQEQAKKRRGR